MSRLHGVKLDGVEELASGAVVILDGVGVEAAELAWIDATVEMLPADIIKGLRQRFEQLSRGETWRTVTLHAPQLVNDSLATSSRAGATSGISLDAEDREALAGKVVAMDTRPDHIPALPGESLRGAGDFVPSATAPRESEIQRLQREAREAKLAHNIVRRDRIRVARLALGLSYAEIGRRAGLSKSALENVLAFGTGALPAVISAMGLDPEWVETGAGEMILQKNQPKKTAKEPTMKAQLTAEDQALNERVFENIKRLRISRGLGIRDFAKQIGLSEPQFYSAKKRGFGPESRAAILNLFGVSEASLTAAPGLPQTSSAPRISNPAPVRSIPASTLCVACERLQAAAVAVEISRKTFQDALAEVNRMSSTI